MTPDARKERLDISTLDAEQPQPRGRVRSRLRLTVAFHPELWRIGARAELACVDSGSYIELSRLQPHFSKTRGTSVGPLADPYISRKPFLLLGRGTSVVLDGRGSTTTLKVNGSLVTEPLAFDAKALNRTVVLTLGRRVVLLLKRSPIVDEGMPKYGLIGESAEIHRVRQKIATASTLLTPILIRGESGTGKDLVARAIHEASTRAHGPYVSVNIAALPPDLAIAELFGHARGSFTGAVQERDGYFRAARGGTIFLDELGEAPRAIQTALLRVLESGEAQTLGMDVPESVDVRILAATDAPLESMMTAGSFRPALYHRLAASVLNVPALRDRPEDIIPLFIYFLKIELHRVAGRADLFEQIASNASPVLPIELIESLLLHSWRGNVRELNNVARAVAAALHARDDLYEVFHDLGFIKVSPRSRGRPDPSPGPSPSSSRDTGLVDVQELSDSALLTVLEECGWRVSSAAMELGVGRSTLYSRIRRSTAIPQAKDLLCDWIVERSTRHDGDLKAVANDARVSVRALKLRMRSLGLDC